MTWRSVARSQDAVISRGQLHGAGLSGDQIDHLSSAGELRRVCRGVYLAGAAPMTYRAKLWAAVLATGGVLGYATAGRLWGTWESDDVSAHVIVAHCRRIAVPDGVRLHRVPVPRSRVREHAGLPVTDRAWTVMDLLGSVALGEASRLADRAVQRGWLRPDDVINRLREHPGRYGNQQLRRIAAQLTDGAAAESERLLHRLLRRAAITAWVPNFPVWDHGELVGVIDVAIPERRVAIEVDGMAYHVDVDRFRGDRTKQNALIAMGWTVLRFTWADLTERPGYVTAMLRRVAA